MLLLTLNRKQCYTAVPVVLNHRCGIFMRPPYSVLLFFIFAVDIVAFMWYFVDIVGGSWICLQKKDMIKYLPCCSRTALLPRSI